MIVEYLLMATVAVAAIVAVSAAVYVKARWGVSLNEVNRVNAIPTQ